MRASVSGQMTDRGHNRLPVITIGGFLGAGKTTLVNEILRQADGRRIVVFVNDFGAINIDHALVETVEDDRISLKNGCVCCSLNDDLVAGVAGFARSNPAPDAIVIEASGVADPRALVASLNALEAAGLASLDTRIYLLDAVDFSALAFEDAEQIIDHAAASDLVLLNKSDIASPQKIAALRKTLDVSAPYCSLLETIQAQIPLDLVFEHHPHRPDIAKSRGKTVSGKDHWGGGRYIQWSAQTEKLLDRQRFNDFARLLPAKCLRAKGTLRFSDNPNSIVLFNLVGHRATLEASKRTTGYPGSQIVAIGEKGKLVAEQIEEAFRKSL